MHRGFRAASRPIRGGLVAALLLTAAVSVAAAPARADADGSFVACGAKPMTGVTTVDVAGCDSLSDAIVAAQGYSTQSGAPATILLMPGFYCPVTIPFSAAASLTLQGVGAAGTTTIGSGFTGTEAQLTTFSYAGGGCSGGPPGSIVSADHGAYFGHQLRLENLTVDATSTTVAGVSLLGVPLTMRDVLVENAPVAGVHFDAGANAAALEIDNSAVVKNATGVTLVGPASTAPSSINETTIADNTSSGLAVDSAAVVRLDNDTVAHNSTGVSLDSSANVVTATNTIVAGNTITDCAGTLSGWEFGGNGSNGPNLIGTTACRTATSDLKFTGTISDVSATNGGPTVSIAPPATAWGAATTALCNPTASDQREYVSPAGSACDIGSVNHGASGTPDPASSVSDLTFPTVAVDKPVTESVVISNSGGGVVGITRATTIGNSFSIVGDGCMYALLTATGTPGCAVRVRAAPTTVGATSNGVLTVQTTGGGVLHISLAALGGPAFTADRTTLVAPRARTILADHAHALATTLTDTTTHLRLRNATINLLSRPGRHGAFTVVHTSSTNSQGAVRVPINLQANTQFEWSYAGTPGIRAVTTAPVMISVAPVFTVLVPSARVRLRQKVRIYGWLAPSEDHKVVVLQIRSHGKWRSAGRSAKLKLQLLPNHQRAVGFILTYRPTQAGTEKLRLTRKATSTNAAGASRTFKLRVG